MDFHRKSPRATFHNYSGGCYFITICTAGKQHFFGEIINGEIKLSEVGVFTEKQVSLLKEHYTYCNPILWVVMPNHLHLLIEVFSTDRLPQERMAVSVIVGGLKRAVTLYAKRNNIEFAWQPRYHDHIIRGNHDAKPIEEYIVNNVAKWSEDCFFS